MRKHFLLLFLMALLPLAGWADAVPAFPSGSKITAIPADLTYTGADQKATILAAVKVKNSGETEDYTDGAVINIYTNSACTTVATTVTNAGTYYVGAYGDGVNYATSALVKQSFTVDKKEITVTANATIVTYGNPITNAEFSVTYAGWVDGVSDGTATTLDSSVSGSVSFTSNYVAGTTAAGAAGVVITPVVTGLSSTNYKFKPTAGAVTVEKRTLTSAMIQAMASVVYNKAQQLPTVVVKDGDATLTAGTDYNAAWKDSEDNDVDPTNDDSFIAADTYTVTLTAAGNYKDDTEKASATYIIQKRDIQLRTLGDDLTYSKQPYVTGDGAYTLSFANHVQWSNVLDGDIDGTTGNLKAAVLNGATIALSLYNGTTTAATVVANGAILNAGTYNVRATVTNADNILNYNVVVGNIGKIIVAKKAVKITPKSLTVPYGTKDEFTTATAITADATDLDADPAVYGADNYLWIGTLVKDEDGNITGVTAGTGLVAGDTYATVFTPEAKQITLQRTEGNDADEYTLTATIPDVEYTNYEFTIEENGTYTIEPIPGVQIWAEDASSFYRTAEAELSAIIIGVEDADITEGIQTAVNQSLYVEYPEGKDATTADADTYTIKIDETKLAAALAPLTNYDVTTVGKYTGTYTIKRVALTVKALDQVRMVGEAVDEVSDKTIDFVEDIALNATDKADIYTELALAFVAPVTTYVDGENKLLATALEHGWDGEAATEDGIYVGGIEITAASVAAYNAGDYNYTLTIAAENATGTLTVSTNVVLELDATLATNTATLTTNAGKKLNVTIKNKKLNAGRWYTISLPFAITPFEFCNTVGSYAIFDRLQKDADKLSFKVSMDAIPAYTPFLVKVQSAVQLGDVVFEKVSVETPAIVETEANSTWKIVNTIDKGQVDNLVYWLQSTSTESIVLGRSTTGETFRGFDAYITTISGEPESEARIYIEEADGSTTAISAITADGEMIPAQGWYTLNGVKLQSMPTEKGVYINNGKKVVLK